jgi:hypothetical protein
MMFPEITTIGGYRQDALKWHPNGLAIDVMIPNHRASRALSSAIRSPGWQWQRRALGRHPRDLAAGLLPRHRRPSWTADYGSESLNHFDHVHIATDGGVILTGDESYYLGSMQG